MSDKENFESVKTFIHDVFLRQQLWNGSSGNKDLLWGELSQKYDLTITTLKRKWENLRRCFRRQLKKIPRNDKNEFLSSPHSLNANFPHYRSMLFLADTIRVVPAKVGFAIKTEKNAVQSSSNWAKGTTEKLSSPNKVVQMKRQLDDSDNENENITPKKRRNSDSVEHQQMKNEEAGNIYKMDSILSNATNMEIEVDPNVFQDTEENLERTNAGDINVSDRLYLKSLLHYFYRIDPSRKLYIRAKIEELLREELYV